MTLYDLHEKPKTLHRYTDADNEVPDMFWVKYQDLPNKLAVRESAIATSAKYSYLYAANIVDARWPPGEPAIATSAKYSYLYAVHVIGGRWPPGERAIAAVAEYSCWYAKDVIGGRWPPGEAAIAKDKTLDDVYHEFIDRLSHQQSTTDHNT